VLAHLPRAFPLPIAVVQHLDPNHISLMPHILARCSPLTVKHAVDGDIILPGVVYLASPARHLQIAGDGRLALTEDPPVRFLRP
jgi:two-component system chemotaxis response regulator CheB